MAARSERPHGASRRIVGRPYGAYHFDWLTPLQAPRHVINVEREGGRQPCLGRLGVMRNRVVFVVSTASTSHCWCFMISCNESCCPATLVTSASTRRIHLQLSNKLKLSSLSDAACLSFCRCQKFYERFARVWSMNILPLRVTVNLHLHCTELAKSFYYWP